jgi:hypothetical protein
MISGRLHQRLTIDAHKVTADYRCVDDASADRTAEHLPKPKVLF